MISSLPAVQANCSHVKRNACVSDKFIRDEKRIANRRHRRALNRATRMIQKDLDRWWDECFNAPTLSGWDLW